MNVQHISVALAQVAWDRYEEASCRASRPLRGENFDLLETAPDEARLWFGIAMACEAEAARHV